MLVARAACQQTKPVWRSEKDGTEQDVSPRGLQVGKQEREGWAGR